jgi:hypothetical protein
MTATARHFLDTARSHLGYTETPAGSNRTRFAAEARHANGYAWCLTFLVAVARRLGVTLPDWGAYTPTMANAFKRAGRWHTGTPQPGDWAFFDFPGDSKARIQHVGVVESADAKSVTCIEGNTSSGSRGSQDNGGGVYRRTRPRSHVVGYGRPAYAAHTPAAAPAPPADNRPVCIVKTNSPEQRLMSDYPRLFGDLRSVAVTAATDVTGPQPDGSVAFGLTVDAPGVTSIAGADRYATLRAAVAR